MKKILILLLGLLLLSACGKDKALKDLGYSDIEIEVIRTLNDNSVALIECFEYDSNLVDLIQDEAFFEDSLESYLNLEYLSNDDRLMIVNKKYDYEYYDEDILALMREKYYIHDRLERYIAAMKTNDLPTTYIVEMVNANRDYPDYTNTIKTNLDYDLLMLCNKYYELGDFEPSDLVPIESKYGLNSYLRKEAYEMFKVMSDDMRNLGLNIWITSAYRSYHKQVSLYNSYLQNDPEWLVDTYSARPGFSEHQTGLVVDVIVPGGDLASFVYSDEYSWMKDNAYKYGFIMRYPEDKEGITGYMFESWHYRYVGKDVATYIYENGITFDEYYAYFLAHN